MPVLATQKSPQASETILPFDASTATTLPTGGKESQKYVVTKGGLVAGITFTERDIFYALKDNPETVDDFGDIQTTESENQIDTDFSLTFLTSML